MNNEIKIAEPIIIDYVSCLGMPDKNGYMYDRDAVFKAFKDWKERNKITGEVYGQLEHGGRKL